MDNILRLVPWTEPCQTWRIQSASLRRVSLIAERPDTLSRLSLESALRRVEPFDRQEETLPDFGVYFWRKGLFPCVPFHVQSPCRPRGGTVAH